MSYCTDKDDFFDKGDIQGILNENKFDKVPRINASSVFYRGHLLNKIHFVCQNGPMKIKMNPFPAAWERNQKLTKDNNLVVTINIHL